MAYPQGPGGMGMPPAGSMAMPPRKPTAAFVLSLIGGIFILLWGLFIVSIGVAAQSAFIVYSGDVITLGAVEAILGLLIMVFGVLLYMTPEHHVVYGVLVLLLAVVSLIGLGGLVIGFILALIGGILGITHKPEPDVVVVSPYPAYYPQGSPYAPPSPGYTQPMFPSGYPSGAAPSPPAERYCPACGAPNSRSAAFCARCGRPLPPVS